MLSLSPLLPTSSLASTQLNTPQLTMIWIASTPRIIIIQLLILASLPPWTLLILLTLLVVLGRQVDAGQTKKLPYCLTMLRHIATSTQQEASTWRKLNLTKPTTQSNQKMLRNATTSGAMYVFILFTRFILLILYWKALHNLQVHHSLGQEVWQWMARQLWCQCKDCGWETGLWGMGEESWCKQIW